MTEASNQNGAKIENLPKPPFEELYQLYLAGLEYDRANGCPNLQAILSLKSMSQ